MDINAVFVTFAALWPFVSEMLEYVIDTEIEM